MDTCARRLRLCCASTHARSADPTPSLTPHRSVLCHTADERRNDSTLGKWQRDKEWRGERSGVLDAGRRHARCTRAHVYSADPLACCEPHPTLLGAAPYTADDSALGTWQRDKAIDVDSRCEKEVGYVPRCRCCAEVHTSSGWVGGKGIPNVQIRRSAEQSSVLTPREGAAHVRLRVCAEQFVLVASINQSINQPI